MPQTKRYKEPFIDTDPSGHCPWCIVIAIGIVAGAVSSGIQSDWDLEATLLGGVIGGVSAGVGYGTFGQAATAFASLGSMGSGIAGGAVAGAVAGGTSGILANLAGYRVNIGLAIASGAAAGGITGGAFGFGAGYGYGGLAAALAAPVAGASGAAISGADPGMGAAIAAAAAFALGVNSAYEAYQAYRNNSLVQQQGQVLVQDPPGSQVVPVGSGHSSFGQSRCVAGTCSGVGGWTDHASKVGPRVHIFNDRPYGLSGSISVGTYPSGSTYHGAGWFQVDPSFNPQFFRILPGQEIIVPYGQYPAKSGYFQITGPGFTMDISGAVPQDLRQYPSR